MGHKVNPLILRIGFIKTWHSRWFANKKDYPKFIYEDHRIRKFIREKFKHAAISKITIDRLADKVKILIWTARPGIIIGRHGADINRLKEEVIGIVNKEVSIDPVDVKEPALDAQLVGQNIAMQIEKRVAFRRAIKRAIEQTMSAGAKGIKVIGYDSMLQNGPLDLMVMQDSWAVGKLQGQALLEWLKQKKGKIEGKVALIMGQPADSNAAAMSSGFLEIIENNSGLELVAKRSHPAWSPDLARETAETLLVKFNNQIDAFVCNNSEFFSKFASCSIP